MFTDNTTEKRNETKRNENGTMERLRGRESRLLLMDMMNNERVELFEFCDDRQR